MRIADVIIAGSVAGAVALATPALARHSDAQKPAEDTATIASPCHSYEMGPDGAWKQVPCEEAGSHAQAPKKSAAHGGAKDSETR
jgi:hypothetical protein